MEMWTDTRIAAPVATITTTTGLAEWLNWIPTDIGKLATLVGIALSSVLIGTHILRAVMEYREFRARMEALKNNRSDPE